MDESDDDFFTVDPVDVDDDDQSNPAAGETAGGRSAAAAGVEGDGDSSDGDWQTRTWELFVDQAERGSLTPEEFVTFARDFNVQTDEATVRRFLRPEHEGRIGYDLAVHLLEAIPIGAVEEDDNLSKRDENDRDVIALGPLDYMRVVWCGGASGHETDYTDDPDAHDAPLRYSLKMPSVSPQFWLIFNASLVFTIVSATIITLVALMWLENVTDVDNFYLAGLERLVTAFARDFVRNAADVTQRDIFDQADTFANWVDRSVHYHVEDSRSDLAAHMTPIATAVVALSGQAYAASASSLVEKVAALRRAELAGVTMGNDRLSSLMATWERRSGWHSVLFDGESNATILTSPAIAEVAESEFAAHPCITGTHGLIDAPLQTFADAPGLVASDGPSHAASYFHVGTGHTLCVAVSNDQRRATMLAAVASSLNTANADSFSTAGAHQSWTYEARLAVMTTTMSTNGVEFLTEPMMPTAACGEPQVDCTSFLNWMRACATTECAMNTTRAAGYDGTEVIAAVRFVPEVRALVVLVQSVEWEVSTVRHDGIEAINVINPRLAENTQVILGTDNGTHAHAQVTREKYSDRCALPNCSRLAGYDDVVFSAFREQSSLSQVRPDATLNPVLTSAAYIPSLHSVFTSQQPLVVSGETALAALAFSFNLINAESEGGRTEVMLVRPSGVPAVRAFDGTDGCPENAICVGNGSFVQFRSDCEFCLPLDRSVSDFPVAYLTELDFTTCERCNRSTRTQPGVNNELAEAAVATLISGRAVTVGTLDYSVTPVHAVVSPVSNVTTAVIAKVDSEVVRNEILQFVLIFVGVAVALIALGLVALIFFSQQTLRKIENEWRSFKVGIEAEKHKFNEMIEQLVPGPVLQRYRARVRCVAHTHTGLSFACIDLCSFSDHVKQWSPRMVVRTVGYFFHVYHAVASKYDVFRLRSFGDVAVFVAGLERDAENEHQQREAIAEDALQLGKFAGCITQLLSPAFSHYPQRLARFEESFKSDSRDAPMPLVKCRIGLHNGPGHAGLVDVGKTPFFELYGSSLAICQRMQATAQPGRVNVSAPFKELLETVDSAGVFEFDALKKAVVKGRGAVSSYPIKSLQLAIDEVLLHQLKIEHAQRMHQFAHKMQVRRDNNEFSESSSQVTPGGGGGGVVAGPGTATGSVATAGGL